MTLRYAVLGTGMMGCEHIRNIALLPGATVSAIADTDEQMLQEGLETARQCGIKNVKSFSDQASLLNTDIADVLVIVSPNDTHYPIMMDALKTDMPILLEKPPATSSDEAWQLVAMAERRKAPIWVAMEYRYMPPVARLLEELESGTAGSLKMLSIVEHRFPFLTKPGNWNRFSARTGGTLVEKCCHFFDLMRLITKAEPIRVFASAGQDVNHLDESYDGQSPDILDNALIIVDFDNGVRASLDLCMFAEGSYWQEQVSVVGDKGKIEALVPGPSRFWPGAAERHSQIVISPRADKAPRREEVEVDNKILAAGDHHGGTYFQHQKFQRVIQQGAKVEVTLRDGAIAVELGAAAHESAMTGEAVALRRMGRVDRR